MTQNKYSKKKYDENKSKVNRMAIVKENNIRCESMISRPLYVPKRSSDNRECSPLSTLPKRSTRSNACLIETILFFHHRLFVVTFTHRYSTFFIFCRFIIHFVPPSICSFLYLTHLVSSSSFVVFVEHILLSNNRKLLFASLNLPS